MGKIAIVTDSNSGITQAQAEELGVYVIPMPFYINEKMYLEGVTLTQEEFYEKLKKDEPISTSQPSPADLCDLWDKLLRDYEEIVHIPMSSGLSASCSTAMGLAIDYNGRVQVVDNQRISVTQRQSVMDAKMLAEAGKSAAEITAALEELKPKVRASFVVDTLMYLYRGGRCNAVAAMAGSVLKLHPKIIVENGAMDAAKKYRGKLHSVVMSYVRDMEANLKNARPERVFITHSGCDRKIVEDVQAYLQSLGIFQEILETRAGGVVSSHCGPGTLGVLFIAK